MLLDEPFTGLDDRAVRIVADRLRQLAAAGAIVVLATHDLDLADGLITRMAVVRGGRLLSATRRPARASAAAVSRAGGAARDVPARRAARAEEGLRDRAEELRDPLDDACSSPCRASSIFSFAFVKEGEPPTDAAAGILWIAIAFSGTLALGRTFERERYGETLKALLLAPAPRPAIYLGKLLGIVALLLAHRGAARADGRVPVRRAVLRARRCC